MSKQRAAPGPTKKHLARVEREQLQSRWIIIATIVTALAVIGLLVFGWADQKYLKPATAAATVNGEKITARALEARYQLSRLNLVSQEQRLLQFQSLFAGNTSLTQSLDQQLAQVRAQLASPQTLRQTALDQMVDGLLIRQEAKRRGITVASADVQEAIEAAFGYYQNGTPTPAPTSVPEATYTPVPTSTPTVGASPTPTETATPTPQETPTQTPTPGPSPTPFPTAGPLPSSTPYTQAAFETDYQSYIQSVAKQGITEEDFRAAFEENLYRDRLLKSFEASVPRDVDQVHARHILVADEATANKVLALLKAGQSWDSLASEYSQDTSNKDQSGDLGWFARGAMVKEFEDAAFGAKVGETVGPVKTSFGYHLIQVLGHEVRPLDDTAYQSAVQKALDDWLTTQRSSSGVVINPNWPNLLPFAPTPSPSP
jgi:parvulin-like peptidyl-prolyl isomerase